MFVVVGLSNDVIFSMNVLTSVTVLVTSSPTYVYVSVTTEPFLSIFVIVGSPISVLIFVYDVTSVDVTVGL